MVFRAHRAHNCTSSRAQTSPSFTPTAAAGTSPPPAETPSRSSDDFFSSSSHPTVTVDAIAESHAANARSTAFALSLISPRSGLAIDMQTWPQQQDRGQQQQNADTQYPHQHSPRPQNPLKRKKSHDSNNGHSDGDAPESTAGTPVLKQQKSQPVKRACNECRQQKLKCNVTNVKDGQVLEPCTRCVKHRLQCSIDPGFRRLEKRQHTAELEKQLHSLREDNKRLSAIIDSSRRSSTSQYSPYPDINTLPQHGLQLPHHKSSHLNPNEAAASRSLLHLATGQDSTGYSPRMPSEPTANQLANVSLSKSQINELFAIYHTHYHHYMPILVNMSPVAYFRACPLLYWTVITTAARRYEKRPGLLTELKKPLTHMLWDTLGSNPQSFQVVKALCLICTWPLPTKSTSTDPSMTLCGTMVSLAMEFGLHRPSHAQDFSRSPVEVRDDDIKDRMNTWVAVNIVAQNVSTGYGMPQLSQWNWYTHGLHLATISPLFRNRCIIERFVDKVTKTLYSVQRDTAGQPDERSRAVQIEVLQSEFNEVEDQVNSEDPTTIDTLHLQIAALHMRLSAFFDSPDAVTYRSDLRALYVAAATLLQTFISMQPGGNEDRIPSPRHDSGTLSSSFATNYIMQMILAAGCTLFKLSNSFFAPQMDSTGRQLFSQTVAALRSTSVAPNDLPQRLAEVLAQLWQVSSEERSANARASQTSNTSPTTTTSARVRPEVDATLQLKVRCRMSMSLVYDSVWRWRDRFGASRNLDRAVEHPTQPDAPIQTPSLQKLAPIHTPLQNAFTASASLTPGPGPTTAEGASLLPPPMMHTQLTHGVSGSLDDGILHSDTDNFPPQHPSLDQATTMDLGLEDWDGTLAGNVVAPFDSLSWALDMYPDMHPDMPQGLGSDGLGYA